jgi:hypothetical protein
MNIVVLLTLLATPFIALGAAITFLIVFIGKASKA